MDREVCRPHALEFLCNFSTTVVHAVICIIFFAVKMNNFFYANPLTIVNTPNKDNLSIKKYTLRFQSIFSLRPYFQYF